MGQTADVVPPTGRTESMIRRPERLQQRPRLRVRRHDAAGRPAIDRPRRRFPDTPDQRYALAARSKRQRRRLSPLWPLSAAIHRRFPLNREAQVFLRDGATRPKCRIAALQSGDSRLMAAVQVDVNAGLIMELHPCRGRRATTGDPPCAAADRLYATLGVLTNT